MRVNVLPTWWLAALSGQGIELGRLRDEQKPGWRLFSRACPAGAILSGPLSVPCPVPMFEPCKHSLAREIRLRAAANGTHVNFESPASRQSNRHTKSLPRDQRLHVVLGGLHTVTL